jgi:hypothetical protein
MAGSENVDGVLRSEAGQRAGFGQGRGYPFEQRAPDQPYFAKPSLPRRGFVFIKAFDCDTHTAGPAASYAGRRGQGFQNNTMDNFVCPVTLGIIDPAYGFSAARHSVYGL